MAIFLRYDLTVLRPTFSQSKSIRSKAKAEMTKVVAPVLCGLLRQFRSEEKMLFHLVYVPRFLELEHFKLAQLEADFDKILENFEDIWVRHTGLENADHEMLDAVIGTLTAMSEQDHALQNKCKARVDSMTTSCVDAFVSTSQSVVDGEKVDTAEVINSNLRLRGVLNLRCPRTKNRKLCRVWVRFSEQSQAVSLLQSTSSLSRPTEYWKAFLFFSVRA